MWFCGMLINDYIIVISQAMYACNYNHSCVLALMFQNMQFISGLSTISI